jgi:hypothetical protein
VGIGEDRCRIILVSKMAVIVRRLHRYSHAK